MTRLCDSNNNPAVDTSQAPSRTGCVVVETFLFFGVMCLAFFEIILVMYMNLLDSVLIKDGDVMGHSPYLAFLKLITHNHTNKNAQQETVWLENDWYLDASEHADDTNVTPHMDVIGGIVIPGHDANATEDFFSQNPHLQKSSTRFLTKCLMNIPILTC